MLRFNYDDAKNSKLEVLKNNSKLLFRSGHAVNTQASYDSGQKAFHDFCTEYQFLSAEGSCIPASEETLILFVTYCAYNKNPKPLSPDSIKQYLFSVQALHVEQGFRKFMGKYAGMDRLNRVIEGSKRVFGSGKRKRLPISLDILRKIISFLEEEYLVDSPSLISAALLAFFGLLRTAEFTAANLTTASPLLIDDVDLQPLVAVVNIRKSKTDISGVG